MYVPRIVTRIDMDKEGMLDVCATGRDWKV